MNTHIRAEYKHIVENDIQEQSLLFHCNDVAFEAKITYSISQFGDLENDSFWNVDLIKPIFEKDYCRKITRLSGMILMAKEIRERHFIFNKNTHNAGKKTDNTVNIYPIIKDKIIYLYFNREAIEKYENKVKVYQTALEKNINPIWNLTIKNE